MNHAEQDLLPFADKAHISDAQWRDRIAKLLDILALKKRPCKACGTTVWFTRNPRTNAIGIWDSTGQSHFATCTAASQFRKSDK